MNGSMVFLISFTTGLVCLIVGILLELFLDTKHIKEIINTYEDLISKINALHSKEVAEYRKVINRYAAMEALRNTKAIHVAPMESRSTEWIDIEFGKHTEDGGLDFPNSKED